MKRLIFSVSFNFSLFILLVIGIQNSIQKSRVNFLINETISLPLSFIIGSSFISGSVLGSFINLKFEKTKK